MAATCYQFKTETMNTRQSLQMPSSYLPSVQISEFQTPPKSECSDFQKFPRNIIPALITTLDDFLSIMYQNRVFLSSTVAKFMSFSGFIPNHLVDGVHGPCCWGSPDQGVQISNFSKLARMHLNVGVWLVMDLAKGQSSTSLLSSSSMDCSLVSEVVNQ